MVGERLAPGNPDEPVLRIYVAGGIAVLGPRGAAVDERDFAGRQARRLFVRLAAIHEPVASVDLADDLWGPTWPAAWQVALRSLISKLRSTLASAGAPEMIASVGGTYEMTVPGDGWLDLDAAADAIHQAETLLSGGDTSGAGAWALVARAVATRPLLPGEEGEWLDGLRRRLTEARLRALEVLGEVWITQDDPHLAARDAEEAIRIDPFRESAHRLLIRAHLAAGDQAAAAHAFANCERILAGELGVAPSPETAALMKNLTPDRRR